MDAYFLHTRTSTKNVHIMNVILFMASLPL